MCGASARASIAARLEEARARTLLLIGGVSEDALNEVHDPLMSPIAWDLGHIATFEDLWLAQNPFGRPPLRGDLGAVYDPFTAPRNERGALPYLRIDDALRHMEAVRERTLGLLEGADLGESGGPLLADAFVYELVLRHEQQHSETILQTLQIMTTEPYEPPARRGLPPADRIAGEMAFVPAGPFEMGAPARGFAYDNERPRHARAVGAFLIDRVPVTNGGMLEFIEDGGYSRPELWGDEGWAWREREERGHAPLLGSAAAAATWCARSARSSRSTPRSRCATCRGTRRTPTRAGRASACPTEAEWEKAAAWDPASGDSRPQPWGRTPGQRAGREPGPARLRLRAQRRLCRAVRARAGCARPPGTCGSGPQARFEGYRGFRAFPYREYSEEFFGGPYRVLRGGSWATQPDAVSNTFRNWDHPERRQIFAGFRCAADAEEQA